MRMATMFTLYRTSRKLSLRQASKQIGVHFSTLSRFESGHELKAKQWARIFLWMLEEDASSPSDKDQNL